MLAYYGSTFLRVALHKEKPIAKEKHEPVSVVVCAKDEYANLKEKLFYLLEQEYPVYEVIVVNHASQDETKYLLQVFSETYPHLRVVNLKEDINPFQGKKFPLSLGIKSAKHDIVLLTDADCFPNSYQWIEKMENQFSTDTKFVLGYGAYAEEKSALNSFIQYDNLATAGFYLGFALWGRPTIGVGRNLAYRKSFFFEKSGFIKHYQIVSGDDDLFVNQNADRANTKICLNNEAFTISAPKIRFIDWVLQKRRHLSTRKFYKTPDKYLFAFYPCSVLLFYAAIIFLLLNKFSWIIVGGIFVFKSVMQIIVFQKLSKRLNCKKKVFVWSPFYELFFTLFDGFLTIFSIRTKKVRWK